MKCEGYKTGRRWKQENYWISKVEGTTGGNRITVIERECKEEKRPQKRKRKQEELRNLFLFKGIKGKEVGEIYFQSERTYEQGEIF